MRKIQKQQAEELIKQIEEAHNQIKKYIEQGSVQPAMELLEDCQNGGITIGTMIEETEGEDHPTVALLEDYCEIIYQIHKDLADYKEINANKAYKLLRQKLIKAGNSFRNNIQIRKEVVFLPYKASMWDSLESVWKAADVDPECDTYVIPIPYYDKNPDGSFREMHYEGDQYPDYVPITSYKKYDFETRKPDAIYIHNPYDEYNIVTSVAPFFFSNNLKKITEKLVYIPYFILGEIKSDEEDRIEGIKHFVTTPAVFNAHKVIVQSEDMKQVYIKVLLDYTNDHSEAARKYWDDKILGTGSPKIDKVLNTKKEDLEVPQEWLRIIEKANGSWKRIVFYNTSIGALLQYNEKMLEKMEHVFRIFKENQDKVALLWRPHPLIKATVESMRPQLWIEYDKLVRKYREEGWGIYDDSGDVDRAIVLSNAYYGDGSSVLQLYSKTQKPILAQNVDCLDEKSNQLLLCSKVCCITQDYIVLISEVTNAVFLLSKNKWEIEKIFSLQNEMYANDLSLTSVCDDNNRMIVVPYCANDFKAVDLISGKQEKIEGCIADGEQYIKGKFLTSVICDKHVWIVGENIKRIIGINRNTLKIFANLAFADMHGIEDIADTIVWTHGYAVKENNIFLASRNYGVILEINNLTYEPLIHIQSSIAGFSYLYGYNEQIFLVDNAGCEYLYDTDKQTVVKTNREVADACWKCIVIGKKRYYFGAFSGKIISYSENGKKEIAYEGRQNHLQTGVKIQFVEQDGQYIFFQERFSGQIHVLDTDIDQCIQQKIDVSAYMREWQNKTIGQSGGETADCYTENEFVSLETLIEYLGGGF